MQTFRPLKNKPVLEQAGVVHFMATFSLGSNHVLCNFFPPHFFAFFFFLLWRRYRYVRSPKQGRAALSSSKFQPVSELLESQFSRFVVGTASSSRFLLVDALFHPRMTH